jgi:hypothetical protein
MFRRIEDIILTNQVNLKEMRASEKCKLRSLRCSKLRAASFGARSLVVASSEFGACLLRARSLLQAQSLLQQVPSNKLRSSELACCKLGARSLLQQAPSSKLRSSELVCCKLGARSLLATSSGPIRSSKLAAASSGALSSSASSGALRGSELAA